MSGSRRLKESLARVYRARTAATSFKPDPSSAFEVALSERLRAVERELDQIRGRLNWLLALIIGAAATDLLLRLFA